MTGPLTIAIDGPSGSGKSSTSRQVARHLRMAYLDTGAMYRAVACEFLERGLDADDTEGIISLAYQSDLRMATDPDEPLVTINGRDVTDAIREPGVSACVSIVAVIPQVRAHLTKLMRQKIAAHHRRIVVEGRDITTVVAPDAQVRVLLVADPEARVARRAAELGGKADQDAVTDQVIRRDRDDSTVSNFTSATDGVVVIDSTFLTLEEVTDRIVALARQAASGEEA